MTGTKLPRAVFGLCGLLLTVACGGSEARDASTDPGPFDSGPGPTPVVDSGLPPTDTGVGSPRLADTSVPDAAPDPDPDAGVPRPAPFFLQHWSDTQIGSGSFAEPAFAYLLNVVKPSFGDVPIVLTGDLVEDGDDAESWRTYRDMVDAAGLVAPTFIEVPGNHDALPFGSLSDYDRYSVAGRSGLGRDGITDFITPNRHVRIIGVNTAGAGNPVQDSVGYVSSSAITRLLSAVRADPRTPDVTLVIGHHSMDDPESLPLFGTDDNVRELLEETHAMAYLFGHRHIYASHWTDGILMTQASTVGNPADNVIANGESGFSLFAIDDQGPVVKGIGFHGTVDDLHVQWPIVMITTPVNPELTVDVALDDTLYPPIENPFSGLPRNASNQPVRVGVFAPGPIETVILEIDDGPEIPMTRVGEHYEASFDTPDADSCTVTVTATAGGETNADSYVVHLD